jgi:hypothetical protein
MSMIALSQQGFASDHGRAIRPSPERIPPMAGDPESLSKRARALAAARARREARAALRQASFDALAAGWSIRHIAEARKVSVKTVSREIERAVAERQLDAPDRFVHLQVARLTKALRLADLRIERGELAAIAPPALERCHGQRGRRRTRPRPYPRRRSPSPTPPRRSTTSRSRPSKGWKGQFLARLKD